MGKKELELYIHIPFCVKKCKYCDFLSFPADEGTQEAYVAALKKEIAFYGRKYPERVLTTVYIGGGTPSWLTERHMAEILSEVFRSFTVAPEAEISIECNPGTITSHKFQVYRDSGINRLSIGLQSADNEELKVLGRIHTWEQFLKTYEMARNHGFSNINIDLMYSLPGQTAETWYASLQKVLRLRPEHISAYSLIIEKGTPFYDLYKFDAVKQQAGLPTDALPNEEEVYRMTKMTEQVLHEAGYEHYEVSNFALPGFACRHNIGYWKRADYLGVGLGAASLLDNIRYTNTGELYTYLEEAEHLRAGLWQQEQADGTTAELPAVNLHAAVEPVGRKAQMEETMFLGLRMTEGVYRTDFERDFGIPVEAVYGTVLQRLQEEQLLLKREGRIFLTERGQDVSNYVLAQFLLD
ncbi:MAG: oxygen-independent coproporphyrinogen III oxidase [Roseburia sp.]|nr:oxygen-independent coproporphyrinogen III oxidase [Roseburia sp.]